MVKVEICCGSYYDALQAAAGGAGRIELNSALMLGGLTPTTATLRLVKRDIPWLQVIAMVRPRGAGFCYTEEEFAVMEAECRELLQNGADGIAFGCLKADGTLDEEKCERMLSVIREAGREAVFHRAFDCVKKPFDTIEELISLGFDRVLTSGRQPTAMEGAELLAKLQLQYGKQIEIVAGSGIHADNVAQLIAGTGITQVHSSCKDWRVDETTISGRVSFAVAVADSVGRYDVVSAEKVRRFLENAGNCTNI